MKSSFFEFNVATSALFTARGNLDVIMHNVANASIPGYSRQVAEQRATRPLGFGTGRGMIGTGSEIYGVTQIRNFYLDKKYWSQTCVLGEYSTKSNLLSITQSTLDEVKGAGISAQFTDLFKKISDLTTSAGDGTYRTNLLQTMDSISTYFKNTYSSLQQQQVDVNDEIKSTVSVINSLGKQIQSLNKQIVQSEFDGSKANDLRDQRALLIDELSRYVNIDVKEIETNDDYAAGKYPDPEGRSQSHKQLQILIDGHEFVNHFEVRLLELHERTDQDATGSNVSLSRNPEDAKGLYDIYWAGGGSKFNMYSKTLSGELKGLIDMRDGNSANYSINMGYKSYTAATGELVLGMDPKTTRCDLNPTGGIISVYDASTGRTQEYHYSSYSYNETTKEGTFEIIGPNLSNITPADFNGASARITSGETTKYKGIPYFMSRLNELARTFAKAINEGKYMDGTAIAGVIGHINAFDSTEASNLGDLLLTYRDANGIEVRKGDPNFNIYNITANNFVVNSDIMKKPELLACSDIKNGGLDNNKALFTFLNINTDRKLFLEGTLSDYITGITGEIGITAKQAEKFEKSYTDLTAAIDSQRMAISGVDLNEELANMIKFQMQYQAAAKLINIIDGIYDTTVNRLGIS